MDFLQQGSYAARDLLALWQTLLRVGIHPLAFEEGTILRPTAGIDVFPCGHENSGRRHGSASRSGHFAPRHDWLLGAADWFPRVCMYSKVFNFWATTSFVARASSVRRRVRASEGVCLPCIGDSRQATTCDAVGNRSRRQLLELDLGHFVVVI